MCGLARSQGEPGEATRERRHTRLRARMFEGPTTREADRAVTRALRALWSLERA